VSLLPLLLNRNRSNRPSLNLEFTANPVPASVTFTRATTATYVNSAGSIASAAIDTPRIDYDPVTLACKGLLIEEARTNLVLNSATLSTQSVTVAAVAHTLTFYGTGTVTLSGVSTAGPLVGTGAYPNRVSLTFTPTAGSLTLTVSGSVTSAQLEAGSFATSYIPTVASQVTRAADVAVMTGSNFSSWYNASEGSFVVEWDKIGAANFQAMVAISDGTSSNVIAATHGSGAPTNNARFDVNNGGVNQASITTVSPSVAGTAYKTSVGYLVNDFASSSNGSAIGTDTSGTVPTVDRASLGNNGVGGGYLNGHIKRLTYYQTRLPNATLVALSA